MIVVKRSQEKLKLNKGDIFSFMEGLIGFLVHRQSSKLSNAHVAFVIFGCYDIKPTHVELYRGFVNLSCI